jgi:predicted Zn-dependent protease
LILNWVFDLSRIPPMKKTGVWITLILIPAIFAGCVTLPETGRQAFIITSESYENQLGADGYKDILGKSKIDKDPGLNEILARVGGRIARATGNRNYRWEYKLIESKEQNAWCMPGGRIAVYTGILPIMENEAGMAAVLGHEVAHAIMRHAGQRISQGMIVEMGLTVADISMKNAKHKDTILGMLGAGAAVGVVLPYSRSHEKEADEVGLRYMAKAGYDPREAVIFWKRFAKIAGGAPPEFLSTHPATASRIKDLEANLPEALKLYDASPSKYGRGEKLKF